jgi:4-alpha-glucanotransferase
MKRHLNTYLDREVRDIQWELIRLGEMSVARWFVTPLQDVLGLDSSARMNLPGREGGNWSWRALPADFEHDGILRLQHFTKLYGRALTPETES